ncbi:hypothetical protein GCM10011390_33340 [Aureimonas endophytica]|uniref:mRNA interferase n=1 Tax=Aureimonas endophytica TaxID=2027858 RepID=A0A917E8N1_9HYPH|nr:type II toxin-antitoxin system PemK/MazF family toxin [Aureimonas endophytica]GGE11542.1 hypothetical protein GCM10011390_33340 [Aureimonas endophytica]
MKRGEIWHVDLNPIKGTEQAGRRFVIIVSADAFNAAMRRPLVVPITLGGNAPRNAGFAVSLMGTGLRTTGVALCDQVRALDIRARGGQYVETAPGYILDEIGARIAAILE